MIILTTQGRETRSQFHDGHPADQEGEEQNDDGDDGDDGEEGDGDGDCDGDDGVAVGDFFCLILPLNLDDEEIFCCKQRSTRDPADLQ